MVNVNLTDNSGKPLQLKGDAPAEVTYPIPKGMESNPPASIPLWHFDEEKGIWMEDGVGYNFNCTSIQNRKYPLNHPP